MTARITERFYPLTMDAAVANFRGLGNQALVLSVILAECGPGDACAPGYERLGKLADLPPEAVRRAVAGLKASGHLSVERKPQGAAVLRPSANRRSDLPPSENRPVGKPTVAPSENRRSDTTKTDGRSVGKPTVASDRTHARIVNAGARAPDFEPEVNQRKPEIPSAAEGKTLQQPALPLPGLPAPEPAKPGPPAAPPAPPVAPVPPPAPKQTQAEKRAAKAAEKAEALKTDEGRMLALWRELSGNTTAHDAKAQAEIAGAIKRDGVAEIEQAIRGACAHPWWGVPDASGRKPCANIVAIMRPRHLPTLAEHWRAAEELRKNPTPPPDVMTLPMDQRPGRDLDGVPWKERAIPPFNPRQVWNGGPKVTEHGDDISDIPHADYTWRPDAVKSARKRMQALDAEAAARYTPEENAAIVAKWAAIGARKTKQDDPAPPDQLPDGVVNIASMVMSRLPPRPPGDA